MKSLVRLGAFLPVCCVLAFSATADAMPRLKPKVPVYHDTVITQVTPQAITISEDKAQKTFKITPFTEITLRGQRANLSDLQPGMLVTVNMTTDPTVAGRITANDPPAHPPASTPKPRR